MLARAANLGTGNVTNGDCREREHKSEDERNDGKGVGARVHVAQGAICGDGLPVRRVSDDGIDGLSVSGVTHTTNAIESINFQLRKITKNRGHFPDKDATMKLLYLGLRNISSERGGFSGTGTYNWTVALNTLARLFPPVEFRCVRV